MENRTIGPKLIITLLSLLLITGAIVAVISISGGNWLTTNPVLAQPPDEALEQNVVVPVTGSSYDLDGVDNQYSPSESGCNHDSAMRPEDW